MNKIVEVWTDAKGWITVAVERDYDRAWEAAKDLEAKLGSDVRVAVTDAYTGENCWINR